MGQKVNPTGFRLGTSKKQNANWYAKGRDFSTNLIQDLKVREYFKKKLKNSSISRIELERSAENFVVSIYTSRPGIIIGKRGEEIDNLKKAVEKIVQKPSQINIKEVKKPDLDAQILLDCSNLNPYANYLLSSLGSEEISKTYRMYKGIQPPCPMNQVYGLACLELG